MIPLKHHVDVRVRFDRDGNMEPLHIQWEDGRKFDLTVQGRPCNAASEAGGAGRRYTVNIGGKKRHLFYANDYTKDAALNFFVESRKYYQAGDANG